MENIVFKNWDVFKIAKGRKTIENIKKKETSSQAPSYASPKLSPAHSLTGVKCRATSVANKKVRKVAKLPRSHKLAKASKSCHKLSKVFPVSKKCSLIMQQILPTPDSAFLQQFNYDFRFWTPLYFTPGIIIFDVLVPRVFRKYTTCMVYN